MFKMQISPRLFHAAIRPLYSFWSRRFALPEYIHHSSPIHPDEVSASPRDFSSPQLSPLLSRGKLYQNSNTPVPNIRAHLALHYLSFHIHLSREFISGTVHLISKLSGRVIQFIEMQWITELDVYRETAPVCWWWCACDPVSCPLISDPYNARSTSGNGLHTEHSADGD